MSLVSLPIPQLTAGKDRRRVKPWPGEIRRSGASQYGRFDSVRCHFKGEFMITTVRSDRSGPCKGCPDRYTAVLTIAKSRNFWPGRKSRRRSAKPSRTITVRPGHMPKRIPEITGNGRRPNNSGRLKSCYQPQGRTMRHARRVRRCRCKCTWLGQGVCGGS